MPAVIGLSRSISINKDSAGARVESGVWVYLERWRGCQAPLDRPMPVISISLDELGSAMGDRARLSAWCAGLEAGNVLYFPETPLPIPADDLSFLLERKQTESGLHKNIAYKPGIDKLTGVDEA